MNAVVFFVALVAFAEPPEAPSEVQGRDLGTRLQVIGSLGLPLGERVRIRGVWYKPKGRVKDDSPLLRVTEVNGRTLAQEVTFHSAFVVPAPNASRVTPRPGEAWEADGFEVGGFNGLPDWAIREVYGDAVPAIPGYQSGFRFVMKFVYITGDTEEDDPGSK